LESVDPQLPEIAVDSEGMKSMIERSGRTNRTTLLAVASIFALILLVFLLRTPKHHVPDHLLGEWHTSDPNYSDRFFEITQVSISFTTGGATVSTGVIKEIKVVPEGTRTLYTVVYDLEGTRNEVSFYYETGSAKGDVIRFKNQQNTIWTRNESS
jgi:hypothetical protein